MYNFILNKSIYFYMDLFKIKFKFELVSITSSASSIV